MNSLRFRHVRFPVALLALVAWTTRVALGFPPAPPHAVFGTVRDELGNPLQIKTAELLFETASGVVLKALVVPGLRPGANYKITVPMDSRVTDDLYRPTALRPTVPFKIKVRIGPRTYLPIEMSGDYARLGLPGRETRIDLTLGEDSDGDGLPDAWERAMAARAGADENLAAIAPGEDSDRDGLSNLDEYLAGTYAFDPKDGFQLRLREVDAGRSVLEFVAVRGRAYAIQGAADLQAWSVLPFRLAGEATDAPARMVYVATRTTLIRALVETSETGTAPRFFRLTVE